MKRASVKAGETLHVETPNGIINIRCGLHDRHGREVDSVEVIPDRYCGERKVLRNGQGNVRLIRCLRVTA